MAEEGTLDELRALGHQPMTPMQAIRAHCRRRAQSDIAAWTASPGRILSVAARYPLDETAGAHKAVEAGGKVGTVVVEPQL